MKWLAKLLAALRAAFKPKPTPPPVAVYVVKPGQRIERIARAVEFDILIARDGSPSLEDVPCWGYKGTNPDTWNGGNTLGPLAIRAKVNGATTGIELKVGSAECPPKEPDVPCSWRAGETRHLRLELLDLGVRLTVDRGASAMVVCPTAGDHTLGIGWPPQKRQGCLGATVTNVVWEGCRNV